MKEHGTWCMVSMKQDGINVEAKIIHKGRGKFIIIDDKKNGIYKDKKIDASDIFYCRIDM